MNNLVQEKLDAIKLEKEKIKAGLQNKGMDMTNIPFTEYHTKLAEISNNYPGYEIEYGSMSLSNIISAGYIPLTAKYIISGSTYNANTLTMTVNGAATTSVVALPTNSAGNAWSMTVYVDIEQFYSGDLDKCKAVTALSYNKTYPDIYSSSFSTAITRWLVPSSSSEDSSTNIPVYSGYNVKYGSMALSDIQSAGFIPMTAKLNIAGTIYNANTLKATINTMETDLVLAEGGSSQSTTFNHTVFLDIDHYFSGDLSLCKNVSTIGHSRSYPDIYEYSFSVSIVK